MYGRLQESDNNSKQNLEISNHKDQKRINNSNFNKNKYHKILNFKWLFIFSYIVYLILILMCHVPFMAEQFSNHEISDNVEYHLTFNCDGKQSHYDVVRFNKTIPGRIDLYYFPKTNTIRVDLDNIYELSIDCRSMYEDECKEIFGFDPKENSNYYKWFFIEKNHLNVNINSNTVLKNFELHDVPKPQVVIVDGDEWLLNKNYYYYSDKGLAISKFTNGTHSVDIYFKPTKMVGPIAQIISSKTYVQINESLSFDGSGSYDSKDNGKITNYLWDFGDGNYTTGKSLVEHSYSTPGVFGVVLTVINQDFNLGHAYLNITVLSSNGLHINGRVNDVSIPEDTYSFKLNLKLFEPYYLRPERDFYWYITREDHSLYILFGENNTDSEITINTLPDKFGNSKVILWLTDSLGNRVCQPLWINITPVNDHPIIFGAPDITLHYNVPYEFNYLPYITDVDTPINEVVLNSSDKTYTIVRGHNITYQYPKSMVHKIEYVILTVWDGEFESSYVVAVWITDDWVPNLVKPLPDVILKEGEIHKNYFDLDEYFIDPDNDSLYYSYGYTHVNVIINLDHTVDFYAPKDWNGKEMTTFRATDPSGALVEDIITVFVIGVNDPPDIRDVPNLVIRYDQDYVFDLTPYIYDEDNEMDELELTTSDPEHIRISRENNLKIILNYPYRPDIPYTHTVKLTISDGENSSFQYITVYVKENYPPVLIKQLPVIFLFEDIPQYDILNLYDYFQDNDSSMLYFKTLNNENILIEFDVDGTINIHSAENWSGKESITFRAIDPETAFIETQVEIRVVPVNDPPEISEIPIQKFKKGEKYKLDLNPYITDIDNNVTQLDIWLDDCEIDYEVHGTKIIFFPTQPKTNTVELHVSDGIDEASQKILIEVTGGKKVERYESFKIILLLSVILLILIIGILLVVIRNYYGSHKVKELFLIYRNGCLILHKSTDNCVRNDSDADIISAMFTAVQDFTRDSFINLEGGENSDEENWKLKKLEFKNNNILLERGDMIYLAVVFEGRPGKKFEAQLKTIREEIETKCDPVLRNWSGDLDALKEINSIIDCYNLIPNPKPNNIGDLTECNIESSGESKKKKHIN